MGSQQRLLESSCWSIVDNHRQDIQAVIGLWFCSKSNWKNPKASTGVRVGVHLVQNSLLILLRVPRCLFRKQIFDLPCERSKERSSFQSQKFYKARKSQAFSCLNFAERIRKNFRTFEWKSKKFYQSLFSYHFWSKMGKKGPIKSLN